MNVINFSSPKDEYGVFSNFARYPVILKGKQWPTSEHYFQAQKFVGTEHEEIVRLAKSPKEAAQLGRERDRPLRSDWEAVKEEIMREVVFAKFSQHAELRQILLATGDAMLVEHTKNDREWGDGGDGSGKNKLGKVLMAVREQLRG